MPGLKLDSVLQAMALGAALGLVAYGTYDLTNLAVLNGYSLRIALIDIAGEPPRLRPLQPSPL